MKVLNLIFGLIMGICPLILVLTLYYFVGAETHSKWVEIIFIILSFPTIYVGYLIFKSVLKIGILKFITNLYGSPELNNLNDDSEETDIDITT